MNTKQNWAALAGGTAAFSVIAIGLSIWSGFAFDFWMLPNALFIGAIITGGGLLLTLGFKRSAVSTCCFSISCAFVAMALLSVMAIEDWSRLKPGYFAIVAFYGLLSGLAGSLAAKCQSE